MEDEISRDLTTKNKNMEFSMCEQSTQGCVTRPTTGFFTGTEDGPWACLCALHASAKPRAVCLSRYHGHAPRAPADCARYEAGRRPLKSSS